MGKDSRYLYYNSLLKKGIIKQRNVWTISNHSDVKECLDRNDIFSSVKFEDMFYEFREVEKAIYIKEKIDLWILFNDSSNISDIKKDILGTLKVSANEIDDNLSKIFSKQSKILNESNLFDIKFDFTVPIIETFAKQYLNIKSDFEDGELYSNVNVIANFLSETNLTLEKIDEYYSSFIFFDDLDTSLRGNPILNSQLTLLIYALVYNTTNLISNTIYYIYFNENNIFLRENIMEYINKTLLSETPLQVVGRVAKEDYQIKDCLIKKNDYLTLIIGASNRDNSLYDINSKNLLSFGHGIHRCLGERLAMQISKKIIDLFFLEFKEFQITNYGWDSIFGFRSLSSLKISVQNEF